MELIEFGQDQLIVSRFLAGESQSDIARAIDLTRERVRQRLKRNGLVGPNFRWRPTSEALAESLATASSVKEVHARFFLTDERLSEAIKTLELSVALDAAIVRWREARIRKRMVSKQPTIVGQIRKLAARLGHTPTQSDLLTLPLYHADLRRIFGSAPNAMVASGLIPNEQGRPPKPLPDTFAYCGPTNR